MGRIVTMPGTSKAGKSFMILTLFAECAADPRFDSYDFINDDAEESDEFDKSYLFGGELAERVKAPQYDGEVPIFSDTIQDFEANMMRRLRGGSKKAIIYALDSLDSLSSTEELEKEYKRALTKVVSDEHLKAVKGSYHTEKAKILGQTLRMINGQLKKTNSLLIIVQQERQKIGGFGSGKTTSGGEAPFYYSAHQVWLTRLSALTEKKIKVGTQVLAKVTKNKLTGKEREVIFDIYTDYGIDDVSCSVNFMIDNGFWKPAKDKKIIYSAEGLGLEGTRNDLVNKIEAEGAQHNLKEAVGRAWNKLEDSIRLNRKRKYGD